MKRKYFENQRPMDSVMLKKMVENGQKRIERYTEFAQTQLDELEKKKK
jgi:hypothetical protein